MNLPKPLIKLLQEKRIFQVSKDPYSTFSVEGFENVLLTWDSSRTHPVLGYRWNIANVSNDEFNRFKDFYHNLRNTL